VERDLNQFQHTIDKLAKLSQGLVDRRHFDSHNITVKQVSCLCVQWQIVLELEGAGCWADTIRRLVTDSLQEVHDRLQGVRLHQWETSNWFEGSIWQAAGEWGYTIGWLVTDGWQELHARPMTQEDLHV
jgi:hypothetical protein